MEKVYNKLVRDNIPSIIEKNNGKPNIRILDNQEFKLELEKKLKEEFNEVIESTGLDRVEELADMLEVISSLARLENATLEDVMRVKEEKKTKRGGFDKMIYLESVEE